MKEVCPNFTIHGEPSGDQYGCNFSYTDPVIATIPQKLSLSTESKPNDEAFYVFLYLLFMVAVILLTK